MLLWPEDDLGHLLASGLGERGLYRLDVRLDERPPLDGKLLTVVLYLSGGTIGGTPTELLILLPPALGTMRHTFGQPVVLQQPSGGQGGLAFSASGQVARFNLYRDFPNTPFAAGSLIVSGALTFSIN